MTMHKPFDPKSVIDRVLQRRGREHIFDDLNPAKTALVVVDMQNGFMMPGVAHSLVEMAPKVVPNINRLARAVRSTGGTVVWVQTTYTDDSLVDWSTFYAMGSKQRAAHRKSALSKGNIGHELWAELEVKPGDVRVEKIRYSAFAVGSSNLAEILRGRGLDTVLITGTLTNVCCDSTARDAMMNNFKTIMVSDGNAAVTDEDHNAALCQFYLTFGDVMATDALIGCLERNARGRAAAE
jgi:ureidoacrylate peracid hydrolase